MFYSRRSSDGLDTTMPLMNMVMIPMPLPLLQQLRIRLILDTKPAHRILLQQLHMMVMRHPALIMQVSFNEKAMRALGMMKFFS